MLEVDGLAVTYRGLRGVDGVTLQVPAGGAVCLLGPNGAGKTTLLRAISGLLGFHGGRVHAGTIRYQGRTLGSTDPARLVRHGIVQVLEGRHVFRELTVEANLRSGAHVCRSRRRAAELLGQVTELFPVLGQRARQAAGLLSGGEQQMLAIGRALMCDPSLLLLDEPSLGIAPLVIRSIGRALRQINANGVGLLLAEQSSALAAAATDHGYLIDTGVVRASGQTQALLADEQVRAAYLGLGSR